MSSRCSCRRDSKVVGDLLAYTHAKESGRGFQIGNGARVDQGREPIGLYRHF